MRYIMPGNGRIIREGIGEVNELIWEKCVSACLKHLGRNTNALKNSTKSAEWKVLTAAAMKRKTAATNVWLTERLHMGIPQGLSRYVGEFRSAGGERKRKFKELIVIITE